MIKFHTLGETKYNGDSVCECQVSVKKKPLMIGNIFHIKIFTFNRNVQLYYLYHKGHKIFLIDKWHFQSTLSAYNYNSMEYIHII